MNNQPHLAWHETLEIHELVAFQTNGLISLKRTVQDVKDPTLKQLYLHCIQALEINLKELLSFFPKAPHPHMQTRNEKDTETEFFAGSLLGMAKTLVRNYAIAITETATPNLREVLTKQMVSAVQLHGNVFYFMLERSYYPSYDLDQLLANDVKNAQQALSM
ncbi:MAG: spore coat protein [Paenibacillus sp.]|jgi:spore coat protein F|nr:spore coat protein [Paenibacillus sp.]